MQICYTILACARMTSFQVASERSLIQEEQSMKVRPSVKPICEKCKVIKRKGRVMVICEDPKHKQKQG